MDESRRQFLKVAGGIGAASAAIGAPILSSAPAAAQATETGIGALTAHELPPLPYEYNALEPYIDEQTMRIHHDKHHAGYVTGLLAAEEALAKARSAGNYDLVQHWARRQAFNGGGHYLHSMFWKVMAANGKGGGGEPDGSLAQKIADDFGGFAAFKAQFGAAAKGVEGSGWALLHYRFPDGRLVVLQAENQHKLSLWQSVPILGVDVWEHAYYLKYQNNRAEYVDQWWNVVNWGQVGKNLESAQAVGKAMS